MSRENNINLIRRNLGMVFQQFNLFPHKTVLHNLTLAPIKLLHLSREEAEARALGLLKKVGISDKANVYPAMLSGGQQQRVAIARALAMQPRSCSLTNPHRPWTRKWWAKCWTSWSTWPRKADHDLRHPGNGLCPHGGPTA